MILSPGEAVIQGYHFYAKNAIEVKVPNNTVYTSNGKLDIKENQPIVQYTLGISLSYDAANHVTGDIVNKELETGVCFITNGGNTSERCEHFPKVHYDIIKKIWGRN